MTQPDALIQLLARMRGDGTVTGPAPLPDVREDPTYAQAEQAKAAYVAAAAAARSNSLVHPAVRAAGVVKAYNTVLQQLASLREDLEGRRRARLEWIETQLPIGPGVPAGTSPADAIVLRAAFTAALERARGTDTAGRTAMLADAERFGDEPVRRAVFTAAYDVSEWQLLNKWMDEHSPSTRGLVDEWRTLTNLLTGYTGEMQVRFEAMAFVAPPRPDEVFQLPQLVATHNATVQANNTSGAARNGLVPMQDGILDVGEMLS